VEPFRVHGPGVLGPCLGPSLRKKH
jgi:hypothetical protein